MSDDILELEIQPPYIGSAYAPQVEVSETSGGHNVAIMYDDAESGITTVDFDVLDGEQGPKGDTGATGATGAAAGFGTVSATVDDSTGTPSVEVTTSGEDTAKNFAFAFHNLKGAQGEPGDVQADGTYPMLHAGIADALSSTYGETETFTQRVSDYGGAVEIQSILGNTIVENDELVSVNISGITSAGSTLEIPASTYFPNGMRGAGTAHDALYADHADTVIGVVDLGTLTWQYDTPNARFFTVNLVSLIAKGGTGWRKNLICVPYATQDGAFNDKTISEYATTGYVYIKDEAYTDAATFKTAMSGVMLYYELATPTTTAIDPPLNLTYPVEAGGTESIIVPTGSTSAAPTFVTLYAYDADGIIDKSQSIIAQVESGVASTNYAVGGYLVMRGTLYRVTSAIATGEAITPGTNCTATTVMAEIVRLTA